MAVKGPKVTVVFAGVAVRASWDLATLLTDVCENHRELAWGPHAKSTPPLEHLSDVC